MALITSVVTYEDKHEADVCINGETYRITTADLNKISLAEGPCEDEIIDILASCATRLLCIKKAFSILSYGDLSVKRLKSKLSEKFERDVSEEVALLMKERGYIDEYASAERFASVSALTKLWGPMRIRSELISRGYERDAVNCAIASLDEDELFDNLMSLLKKKMPSGIIGDIKMKSKLCAYLQRMGYPYSMINTAMGAYDGEGDYFGD